MMIRVTVLKPMDGMKATSEQDGPLYPFTLLNWPLIIPKEHLAYHVLDFAHLAAL